MCPMETKVTGTKECFNTEHAYQQIVFRPKLSVYTERAFKHPKRPVWYQQFTLNVPNEKQSDPY